jgi:hypothetical protein
MDDAKAPNCLKNNGFKDLGNYSEWPKVAGAVIKARDSAKKLGPKMYVQFTGLNAVFVGHEGLREREPAARRAPSTAMVSSCPPLHYFYAIFTPLL